jgi:hypothetical protein
MNGNKNTQTNYFTPGLIGQMVKGDNTVRVKTVPNGNTLPGIEIRSDENQINTQYEK